MQIELAYKKLMEDEKLTFNELPTDAKIGIDSINNILKAINMAEKKGRKVSDNVISKVKANDKWVVREIIDYVEDKNENKEPLPNKAKEVVEQIKTETEPVKTIEVKPTEQKTEEKPEEVKVDPKGVAIDEELKKLFESGKTKHTLEELKTAAPKAYNVIFDTYDNSGDNGIETSFYKLIEVEDKVFEVSKL